MNAEHGSAELQPPEETPKERYYRIKMEILNKVTTEIPYRELYLKNAFFHRIVDMVAEGGDTWEIIAKLIGMEVANEDRFRKLLEQWPAQTPPVL
jgi:hypothetical protein